jgi:hypothetical protein
MARKWRDIIKKRRAVESVDERPRLRVNVREGFVPGARGEAIVLNANVNVIVQPLQR